ncbi:phosphotransferase family protein [Pseudonocardia sp.]|uniref:phosphotransferase family protein n=1 Tax=Pseudonocardia sp. TaxID=60912 RepID=UPI003D125EA3
MSDAVGGPAAPGGRETDVAAPLARWLDRHVGPHGPWRSAPLAGGNSNETHLLRGGDGRRHVLRRPPRAALSSSAHGVAREFGLLTALYPTAVPVPRPIALCEDPAVAGAPFLVMEHVADALSVTDTVPPGWAGDPGALTRAADDLVDALAALHRLDPAAVGPAGFGRPDGFLGRQPGRWYAHWEQVACRPLPAMAPLARWLTDRLPGPAPTGFLHGDFHLDNCLFDADTPRLRAVIDWELATVGDPLLDVGLLLAFWGERPGAAVAMPAVQGVSRLPGAPPREHLLERYESAVGRPVGDLAYYRVLALYKLAAIVEGAYAQFRAGALDTPYAAALEHDVPALLDEAMACAGLAAGRR